MQPKKTFALVDYVLCNHETCNLAEGRSASAGACTHKVLKQLDGPYEQPMIFQDMCMGCWDCIEACPLKAVFIKNVT